MTAAGAVASLFAFAAFLLSGLAMLSVRSVVHAAVLVMGALLCVAASMLALSAGFAAALMILVHAGAIVTVLLFVAVSLPAPGPGDERRSPGRAARLVLPGSLLIGGLLLTIELPAFRLSPAAAPSATAQATGALLFGPWAIAVEVASLLLLMALMGARLLLRPDQEAE